MKKYSWPTWSIYLPAFLISSAFSLGCKTNKDSDGDGITDLKDKCVSLKGFKPDGCPLPPQLGKVNLYLETSASMGGYFAGASEFKQIVSDLAVKIDKEISPLAIHFVSDTITHYNGNATKFSSAIATTKIALARSSELHEIFNKIARTTKNSDISILVSDCILSFPNAQVKANGEINRQSASGTLKNNIYATFIDLKSRGQAASLYAFSSKFFGKYFDYQNVPTKLTGTVRPFYIWVIAKNNLLTLFDARLSGIPNFLPEESLHFGALEQKVNHYRILTQLGLQGSFKLISSAKSPGDIGLEEVEQHPGKALSFSAVADLSSLPAYARTVAYLNRNLKITTKGCTANVTVSARPNLMLKNKRQIAYLEQSTHVFKVTISELRLDKATLQLSLPLNYDNWPLQWSTMNDKKITSLGKKTFALEYLVQGVKEAYNNAGKNFIDLNFQINQ